MAFYTPRPDGLVDADVGGRMLPMAESHAQAAGLLPAPMPPVPTGNPYAMANDPSAVAGPGGAPAGDEAIISNALNNPQAPAAPLTQGNYNGLPLPAPGHGFLDDTQMHGGAARPEFAAGVQKLQDEAPRVNKDAPGDAHEAGLTRIDPRGYAPQGPPGIFGSQQAQGPGRIVQTSKGGDLRTSFVRRPGEELDPAAKAYADSLDPEAMRSQRETSVTNTAIARDNAVAADMSATAQAQGELLAQQDQVARNRQSLQQKLDIVDRRQKEAESATPQTRSEVLQSRGAVAGVLAGISIALGGYLQGMRGGENPGLKIINDSIESEISSQRAKWEASKDKIAAARTDFGQAMQLYGDPNMAEADMRMRALTLASRMAESHKAQGDNAEWLANQQQLTQQLAGQAAGEKQKWKTLADGQVVQENYQYQKPTFAQVGGPPKLTKEQREDMKDARKRQVRLPDGSFGYVANDTVQKDVQGTLTAGTDVVDGMHKLLAIANDNTLTDPEKRARFKALTQDIRPIISVAKQQGAMGEQEVKGYEDILGDPNAIVRDNASAIRTGIEQQVARNNRIITNNVYKDADATTPYSEGAAQSFQPGLK